MAAERPSSRAPSRPASDPAERRKQLRGRNLAMLAALVGFAVLVYIVAIVRMGGS